MQDFLLDILSSSTITQHAYAVDSLYSLVYQRNLMHRAASI